MITFAPYHTGARMTGAIPAVRMSGYGAWLRAARAHRGLTMEALAERADTAAPVISNLERGKRNPSRTMVKRIAGGLVPDGLDGEEREAAAARLESEGMTAAGFVAEEDQYPEELQQALAYAGILSEQSQKYIFQLWREQAHAHYDIELKRREAERHLEARQKELDRLNGRDA